MSFKTLLENIEALRDEYLDLCESNCRAANTAATFESKAFHRGRTDTYSSVVADLSRIITHWKTHPAPYKLVVGIDHGSFDGIYTTAPEGTFEAFVHTYDLDNLPTPQVEDAHPFSVDDETIARYLKPHGLKVSTLKADMDLPDDEVLVAIPGPDDKLVYYPVVLARNVRQSGYTVLEPAYPLKPIDPPVPGSI